MRPTLVHSYIGPQYPQCLYSDNPNWYCYAKFKLEDEMWSTEHKFHTEEEAREYHQRLKKQYYQ